jgi:hypothetical protein
MVTLEYSITLKYSITMALFFSTKSVATTSNDFDLDIKIQTLIINGDEYGFLPLMAKFGIMSTNHTYLYDMKLEFELLYNMNQIISNNERIHMQRLHVNIRRLNIIVQEIPNPSPLSYAQGID